MPRQSRFLFRRERNLAACRNQADWVNWLNLSFQPPSVSISNLADSCVDAHVLSTETLPELPLWYPRCWETFSSLPSQTKSWEFTLLNKRKLEFPERSVLHPVPHSRAECYKTG